MSKLDNLLRLIDLMDSQPESDTDTPFGTGDSVIVRTVTHYFVGRVVKFGAQWLTLSDASWIADTGRWSDALSSGNLNEIEPYPNGCSISIGAIVDISRWSPELPKSKK